MQHIGHADWLLDLVATVEHVVDGATWIKLVRNGKTLVYGTVIGDDLARDVALVHTSKPLPGYRFRFAPTGASGSAHSRPHTHEVRDRVINIVWLHELFAEVYEGM
ncbi:MAG TPA: hypothetical protein VFD88_02100 [Clostridia bacterium]|nr:hypothetical protein [Clostridia bacterium]